MTAAEVLARADDLGRQLVHIGQMVDSIVQRREDWRRWRDANCGRELAPSDTDYSDLWPTPINPHVSLDVDEAAALFDRKIAEMIRRHDEIEALRGRAPTSWPTIPTRRGSSLLRTSCPFKISEALPAEVPRTRLFT